MNLDKKIIELLTGPTGIAFATLFGALSFIGILTGLANLPQQLGMIVRAYQWVTHGLLDLTVLLPFRAVSVNVPSWVKDYIALSMIMGGAFFRSGYLLQASPQIIAENLQSFRKIWSSQTHTYGSKLIKRMMAWDNLTGSFVYVTSQGKLKSYCMSAVLWPVFLAALIPFAVFSTRVKETMNDVKRRHEEAHDRNKEREKAAKTSEEMMLYAYMNSYHRTDIEGDEHRHEHFKTSFAIKRIVVFHLAAVPALALVLICVAYGLAGLFS